MDLFGITGYGYNNIKSKKQERKHQNRNVNCKND